MRIKCALRPMWCAARASCVLRSVPKSKLMAVPAMSGLRRITGWGNNVALRAFWMESVPAARLALRASRLIDRDRDAFGGFSPYDCSGRGPVWDRDRFVEGQI